MNSWKHSLLSCSVAGGLVLGFLSPAARANPVALSTLDLVGTSQLLSPNLLRLTPNFDTNPTGDPPAGAAWTPNVLNVVDPFSVGFSFRMSGATGQTDPADGSGGDGIAFVIQNDFRGVNAIGRGAGGMGFMGIFDSVAVMFDTYQNNYAYGDPSGNYIAVNTRGTDFNVPHHFCKDHQLTNDPKQAPDLPNVKCDADPSLGMKVLDPSSKLDDESIHQALIVYNPGTLAVYLDSIQVLKVPLNLAGTLSLQGTDAYLGFTAGTRFSYQNQDIVDFSYATIPEPGTAAACLAGLVFLAAIGWRGKSENGQEAGLARLPRIRR